MNRTNVIEGPMIAARNWSADAGAGSIHDDATAAELGFRGGTVAGDVHMNQFPPVLVEAFGPEWFERGNLSLRFRNATVDLERVRAYANRPVPGMRQIEVWMRREDGLEVCRGTAALDDHGVAYARPGAWRYQLPDATARAGEGSRCTSLKRNCLCSGFFFRAHPNYFERQYGVFGLFRAFRCFFWLSRRANVSQIQLRITYIASLTGQLIT